MSEQPIKPSAISGKRWETVYVDFGGPYPDSHYNLVIIDYKERDIQKLKQSSPEVRPPFNSKEYAEFAENEGFKHHRVIPLHLGYTKGPSETLNFLPFQTVPRTLCAFLSCLCIVKCSMQWRSQPDDLVMLYKYFCVYTRIKGVNFKKMNYDIIIQNFGMA